MADPVNSDDIPGVRPITLAGCIHLAFLYHRDMPDRSKQPFIGHPLRVMARMGTEEQMKVAVLHDIVEDTECTLGDLLLFGVEPHLVDAVNALTRRTDEVYMDYIRRCGLNELARVVKLADILDNIDPLRITDPKWAHGMRKRYAKAWRHLTGEPLPE